MYSAAPAACGYFETSSAHDAAVNAATIAASEAGPDRAADLPGDLAGPGVDAATEDVPDDEEQQHLLGDGGVQLAVALGRRSWFGMSGHGVNALPAPAGY